MKLEGLKVLVVEDDPLVLFDISQHLRDEGANVHCAHRLPEAVRQAQGAGLSVAILDHKLLDTDTTAVYEVLRRRSIPFVVYSGATELPRIDADCIHIGKPATVETLVAALLRLLARFGGQISEAASQQGSFQPAHGKPGE
jgi:DNA-binding response OmpR family regulator